VRSAWFAFNEKSALPPPRSVGLMANGSPAEVGADFFGSERFGAWPASPPFNESSENKTEFSLRAPVILPSS